ncbi:MAG: RNA chaperone Hfq [Terracidiphilus sp.]|jgi:sRNA-binding regulator protein Hfq
MPSFSSSPGSPASVRLSPASPRVSATGKQPALTPGHEHASPAFEVRKPSNRKALSAPLPFHFHAHIPEEEARQHHAELFYLQKQIQSQTPMVIVLEDGEMIEGRIEWYDRNSIKVRGRTKSLIYKPAIKYMYKVAENGQ